MWSSFSQWAMKPFDLTDMTPGDWFRLFGVLILVSFAYGMILRTAEDL